MAMKKSILIIGIFLTEQNKNKIYRTAADQLAELLEKNQYSIIKVSTHVGKILRFLDTLFSIIKKRKEYTIAIVPLYGGTFSLFWAESATVLLRLLGKKIILIIHGGSIPSRMENIVKAKNYLRTIKRADTVVCPSDYIIHTLRKFDIEAVLIENVLNLSEYHFHPKDKFRPHIFWMRTFEDAYNPLMAVRFFAQLKKKFPEAKMIMAGRDMGLMNETKKLATILGIIDNITFPGYLSNKQKNEIAEEYDFYICTNKIDNAPVSMIEMMCLGLPIVSVSSGGIPYLITNDYDGLLVEAYNENEMVERISLIIKDSTIGLKLVKNGLNTCKRYGEKPVLEKWNNIFEHNKIDN